jgi:hypothetical protein
MSQGYNKRTGTARGRPYRWTGTRPGRYFFAGAIWAESALTLGGLVALPAGEWAPDVSSGFCSGAL